MPKTVEVQQTLRDLRDCFRKREFVNKASIAVNQALAELGVEDSRQPDIDSPYMGR